MLTLGQALVTVLALGLTTLFCRAAPFLLFRGPGGPRRARLIAFVELAVPPVAMTILAFSAISASFKEGLPPALATLTAAGVTALLHLWRRNALLSIVGGTILFIILNRIFIH